MKDKLERTIRAFAGPVNITAGEGENAPPKFDVTAYTGGALMLEGWDMPVVIDLSGMQFGKSLIANLDHERQKRVGHVTAQTNDHKTLQLAGVASAATAARAEVVDSAKSGFVWQASIEASSQRVERVPKGKSVTVNSQTFPGPLDVVRASILKGFAFVSHGADDNTTVSIAAQAALSERNKPMNEFETWLAAKGLDGVDLKSEAKAFLQSQFDKEQRDIRAREELAAKHKNGTATLEEVTAKIKADRARESKIAEITAETMSRYPRDIEAIESISRIAIDEEWDAQHFELQVLKATQPKARDTRFRPGGNDARLTNKLIEAALCRTGGLKALEKDFDEETLEASDKHFRDGIGLQDLLLIVAKANGHDMISARSDIRGVLRAAFPREDIKAFGFSTLSLPGILSNVANKFLIEGWMGVDQAWRQISNISSVRDFKTRTSYSLTGHFQYEKVGPAGEIKHGDVSELSYTNKAETYARMFAITRQDIINDDLGALTAAPRRLGRGAALKLNDVFWGIFLNNSSFFTSGNANVSTGAGSALGTADGAAIGAAEVVFMNQTDPDGKPLGATPSIMLVPPTLFNTGARWMGGQLVVTGANTTVPNVNVYQGRYRVVTSPYMENSSYTGFSAAAWYLLANLGELAVIDTAFLNGKETPTVETAEADFSFLGIQMRGFHDFGVALQEKRAGVRSAGS